MSVKENKGKKRNTSHARIWERMRRADAEIGRMNKKGDISITGGDYKKCRPHTIAT